MSLNARTVIALATIYILWGSSYLAIRFALEGFPPFLLGGARFVFAGTVLYLWARARARGPLRPRLWPALLTGFLMIAIGNGAIVLAERRVPSGLACLIVSTEPLWMALAGLALGESRPGFKTLLGLVLGFGGIGLLGGAPSIEGGERVGVGDIMLLTASVIAWVFGSLYTRTEKLAATVSARSAITLLSGGIWLLALSGASGEWHAGAFDAVSARSLAAIAYLAVFCSIGAFSAYLWLLKHASLSLTATYAYVNPLIAVLLGWLLAGETITRKTGISAVLIILAIVLTVWESAQAARREPASV